MVEGAFQRFVRNTEMKKLLLIIAGFIVILLLMNTATLWNVISVVFFDEEYRTPIVEGVLTGSDDVMFSGRELGAGSFTVFVQSNDVTVANATVQAIKLKIYLGSNEHDILVRSVVYNGVLSAKAFTFSQSLFESKFKHNRIRINLNSDSAVSSLSVSVYRAH